MQNFFASFIAELIKLLIIGIFIWFFKTAYTWRKYSLFKTVSKFRAYKGSGAQGFYNKYPPEENRKIWKHMDKSFDYLGMSASTILDDFLTFLTTEEGRRINCRFLLINPDKSDTIQQQEAFRLGINEGTKATTEEKKIIVEEGRLSGERIRISVDKIKNSWHYKNGKIKIKYFDETIPWWIYTLDEQKIFVGLLEPGKDGRQSPLIVLEKKRRKTTLFDAFENNWNRIWRNAIDA